MCNYYFPVILSIVKYSVLDIYTNLVKYCFKRHRSFVTIKMVWEMDEDEYTNKYMNLRVLKSIQEYLKADDNNHTTVYPIKVPDDLLYQTLKTKGPKGADSIIHHIFKLGLTIWSEKLYNSAFGSQQSLEEFIELVKERTKGEE